MDTNESDAMANQVDVDKIIFRIVFIDLILNFYKAAYVRYHEMPFKHVHEVFIM